MNGIITLLIALSAQIGFLVYQIVTKNRQTQLKYIIRIAAFALFSLLLVVGVYWWGFRWMGLFILLFILAISGVIYFIRRSKTEKEFKKFRAVFACVNGCILLTFSIIPGILFPQFEPIAPTGNYDIETVSVTYVDESREEPFSESDENRKLTVQFWYPAVENRSEIFPLAVFSHGSFGYRGSNLSTFEELASNGYVVCSIDHSYHAFFSKHTDNSTTPVNMEFLNDAVNITNNVYDDQITYNKTHEWLDLRIADMDFILQQVLDKTNKEKSESLYALIDTEKIGLMGHSLGGATAAQLGRERSDIDAAIVIDGTMIGEEIACENDKSILNSEPYPIPLLNLYNESHYEEAHQEGIEYNNLLASANAIEAYDVVIRGSGHLNFTDLPLFSPTLAGILGTGEVDSRYCIETMNEIILDFFNHTLKDAEPLKIQTEY